MLPLGGALEVTTDANGRTSFGASFGRHLPNGWFVSATATDLVLGETSEFSNSEPIGTLRGRHP